LNWKKKVARSGCSARIAIGQGFGEEFMGLEARQGEGPGSRYQR